MAQEKILLIAPSWVGDSIHFLPAVAALRRGRAGSQVCLAARPGICELHAANPLFDRLLPLPAAATRGQRLAFYFGLRRERFSLALAFPNSFSAGLSAFLSGARQRLGRPGQGRRWLLTQWAPLKPDDRSRPVAEEYLDLALLAGGEAHPEDLKPRLPLTQSGVEEQNRIFREAGLSQDAALVALCPTSAYGEAKCWPQEHWASLARLLKERRYQPLLLGAPSEIGSLRGVAAAAGGGIACLTPRLPGLAACAAKVQAVVANDSGPLHVAAAVGARCVGLFGPISPAWSAPASPKAHALYHALACSPCYARVCPLGHQDCLRKMEPAEVLEEVLKVMRR
jgi:heptosyltransferase-2